MDKKVIGIIIFFILGLFSLSFCEEQITITTYYPSPYGSYNELYVASRVGIGTTAPQGALDVNGVIMHRKNVPLLGISTFQYWVDDRTGEALASLYFTRTATENKLTFNTQWHYQISSGGRIELFTGGTNPVHINNNVGIGVPNPTAKLHVAGDLRVNNTAGIGGAPRAGHALAVYGKVSTNFPGEGTKQIFSFDLAEDISAAEDVEPGDVVVIDSNINQFVTKTTKSYDVRVAGVISESPAFHIAMPNGKTPLALAGRVLCKVTTRGGGGVDKKRRPFSNFLQTWICDAVEIRECSPRHCLGQGPGAAGFG